MRTKTKFFAILIAFICAFTMMIPSNVEAATIKLSATKKTVEVGKTTTLKVKGTKKKVTWSSSNKKIATVSKNGKVKGIKVGNCTIKAKVSGKTYKCKVTVKKAKSSKTLTPKQVQAKIEAACRAHGMVSFEELVEQLVGTPEYSDVSYEELMSSKYDASWFQCSIPITNNFSDEDYYAYAGMNSPAYTIEYVRTDGDYYIFTCYRY